MEADIRTLRETAIHAARRAGRLLAQRLPDPRQVHVKGFRDIVTDADLDAEAAILETVQTAFPHHALLTEENGVSAGSAPYTWVVDPLDGTTNYSRRFPCFCVSIGLLHQGRPLIGVVYEPLRDHLFVAQRGEGAALNGAPLRVSPLDRLDHAVIGLDWAHAPDDRRRLLDSLQRLAPACGTLRAMGTAALGFCYVAAGWLDAYFHAGLKPWDMAAGVLLVQEAGGQVTNWAGRPWQPWEPRLLVSNRRLHPTLLERIGEKDLCEH